MSEAVDRVAISRAVRAYIRSTETPTLSECTNEVAAETGAPADAVEQELEDLKRHGFVYTVDGDDGATEVRLV